MLLEALSSAIAGLVLAWVALRWLPHRLPGRVLVVPTGMAGGLFGAFLVNTAVDAGSFVAVLVGAVVVSVASLSLLVRPAGRLRRSATA